MRLSRRKSIFTLTTILIIFGFGSHRQLLRKKSSQGYQKKELAIAPDVLPKYNIDKEQIYQNFLKAAQDGSEGNPALLYQGIQTSPYKKQINSYPTRLKLKPNGKNLVDCIEADATFNSYPIVGKIPTIDENSLDFLHHDIKEACICLGSFSAGEFKTKWLGRNALSNQEFWSATKFIPILNVIYLLHKNRQNIDINYYKISGIDQQEMPRSFNIYELARDIVSYEENIATSNALAEIFKRFSSQIELENWLKSITGNKNLIFRGDYGEKVLIEQPKVTERNTEKTILIADTEPINPNWTDNTISAYDLTRMISMLGWHNYIPPESRLPGVKWKNLESVITAMGTDSARLTDLAIKELGLQNDLDSVVILSKIGNGTTILRKRTEAVYVALVQLVVRNPNKLEPAKMLTLSMALRGARTQQPRDLNREVVELDARMATEVAKIIQKAISYHRTIEGKTIFSADGAIA